jgi:hypothetical protein
MGKPPRRRGPGRPFKKGQSGNPNGRHKTKVRGREDGTFLPGVAANPKGRGAEIRIFSNLATEARKFAGLALETLVDVMKNGATDAVRLAAANSVLDRGYGKPRQSIDLKADVQSVNVNLFEGIATEDQRLAVETLAAISSSPAALSLAIDIMNDPTAMTGTIPDDVIDLEPMPGNMDDVDVLDLRAEMVE